MRYLFCERNNALFLKSIINGEWKDIKAEKVGFNKYNLSTSSKDGLIACNVSKRDVLEIQSLLKSMSIYGLYKGNTKLL